MNWRRNCKCLKMIRVLQTMQYLSWYIVCISRRLQSPKSSLFFDSFKMQSILFLTVLPILVFLNSSVFAQSQSVNTTAVQEIKGELSRIGDTLHLELQGSKDWNYDLQRKVINNKVFIEVQIPKLNADSVKQISSWNDKIVKTVQVLPGGFDQQVILKLELADNNYETFDYLTDQPSRLIVDFYPSKESVKKNISATTENTLNKKNKITKLPEKKQRNPASSDLLVVDDQSGEKSLVGPTVPSDFRGIFDGADPKYERFSIKDYAIKEDAIIRSQENVYINFPMLEIEGEHFEKIKSLQPLYEITAKEEDENQQARLLITLFENKRYAVYIKTLSWFQKKYPKSAYNEIIQFMTADVYFKLWEKDGARANFETAIQKYREATELYPESKLATRAQFLIGYASFEKQNYLGALRIFQKYLRENKGTALTDRAELQVARSFLKLGHFEDALKTYENLEKNATLDDAKIEATYLKGDVAFKNKNYTEAMKLYEEAIKKYPQAVSKFPNAFYNKAECNFWLGKYKKGLDDYREFLTRFPAHGYDGYAMTRLGELLEILGADEKQVMGAYIEAFFRYGDTPGAAVARIRTLSKKMATMKEKEAEEAIKEIQTLAQASQLPKIDLFSTITIVEGLANRNQHSEGLKRLLAWYQQNPNDPDLPIVANRIVRLINDEMFYAVENGKFIDALNLHTKYGDQWMSKSDRVDTLFVLGRAFEQAGVFKDAEQMYRESYNRIKAMKGTKSGKSRSVFERLPTEEDISLRLARVAQESGNYKAAYEYLRDIKNYDKLNESQQVERVVISARILEKKGELEASKRYLKDLIDNWKGQVGLVIEPTIQLAKLQTQTDQVEDAEKNVKNAIKLLSDAEKVPSSVHAATLSNLAEIQIIQKNNEGLIQTWTELLKYYEDKQLLDSVRYRLGEIHFKNGNLQKATEIWGPLKNKKNQFWYKLADEHLKNNDWKSGYKKYIQRIPAMANMKGSL